MDEVDLYYVAMALDPWFKFTLIREQYGDDAEDIINRVRLYLKKEYLFHPSVQLLVHPDILISSASMGLHQFNLLRQAHPRSSEPISDIDKYLDSRPIDWDINSLENHDPDWLLKWWKSSQFLFPLTAQAARDHLAIPASEVDVERLFCGGRDQLGIRRWALKGETMRFLTLLKSYFDRQLNNGHVQLPEASLDLHNTSTIC